MATSIDQEVNSILENLCSSVSIRGQKTGGHRPLLQISVLMNGRRLVQKLGRNGGIKILRPAIVKISQTV